MPAAPAIALGHDLPAPEPPAGLFVARYSQADQDAHPELPLTLIVKDVLHVGTIRVRDEANGDRELDWTITEPLLTALADSHVVGRSRGYATVLGKTHGDKDTRLIHPDDQIAPVDELKAANGVLWASAYVTPAQAAYLRNPALKVSPYILAGYRDTGGHLYPAKVLHVAVTDNPRVPGQGPFTVALCDSKLRREVPMNPRNVRQAGPLFAVALAEGDELPEGDDLESAGSTSISGAGVEKLIEYTGELLKAAYNLTLPEGTDGKNLVERLGLIISMASQMNGGSTETVEEPSAPAIPMSQGLRRAPANDLSEVARLRKQLADVEAARTAEKKAQFAAALSEAGKAGVAADVIEAKRQLGEKYGYDLELLAGLPSAVPMGNPIGGRIDGSAPSVQRTTATKRPDPKDVQETVERLVKRGRVG